MAQRAAGRRRSAPAAVLPGAGAEELQGSRSARSCSRSRATRAFIEPRRPEPLRSRAGPASRMRRRRSASRVIEALEVGVARRAAGAVDVHRRSRTTRAVACTSHVVDASRSAAQPMLALFERAALRGLRHLLSRAGAEPVLVQLAGGRLRDLPRLRPHHRHRLRPGDAGREQDAARRRGAALADQVYQGMPGRPASSSRRSAASRSTAVARARRESNASG